MAEQWMVRVEGKEYGPVDLETLCEWRQEGRLLPDNEVRREQDTAWGKASSVPELFSSAEPTEPPVLAQRRRGFAEIFFETFRIYGRGFLPFFCLALLVAVPSCVIQISSAYIHLPVDGTIVTPPVAARLGLVLGVAALIAIWPIFLAGIQIATAEFAARRKIGLRAILQRAVNFWPRVALLCLIVYGSYFLWSVIPVLAIFSLISAQTSPLSALLGLLILGLQVYMTARLFVNFLFWQQTSVLAGHGAIEALRESRELARSRRNAPRLERPLWRGAILVSLWLVVLVAVSVAAELPFVLAHFQGITNLDQAFATAENLSKATTPDTLTLASYVATSLLHALVRPLLGISFVLVYFDAKA
jgi:hypothetical protein